MKHFAFAAREPLGDGMGIGQPMGPGALEFGWEISASGGKSAEHRSQLSGRRIALVKEAVHTAFLALRDDVFVKVLGEYEPPRVRPNFLGMFQDREAIAGRW